MTDGKMHDDEPDIDIPLVRRLLEAQFPAWKRLRVEPVRSSGTVNAIFRLGDDMVVRLLRLPGAMADIENEQRWLPRLAPHLPVAVPEVLATGEPTAEYPFPWSICRWVEGSNPTDANVADQVRLAEDLAAFTTAFWRIDLPGGPPAYRGGALAAEDPYVRDAIAGLRGSIDTVAATAAWNDALHAPAWTQPRVWVHSDLLPGNLLVADGRLSGVIDFGTAGMGDPACDTMPAWTLFDEPARDVYRARLGVDDATWARGRGWALALGLIALPYYRTTNPVFADLARRTIATVLADHSAGLTTTPATDDDLGLLVDVIIEGHEEHRAEVTATQREQLHHPESGSLLQVIRLDGRRVGRFRVVRTPDRVFLAGIQILPEFRGRGIGTTLIRRLLDEGRSRGVPVQLEVSKDNPGAQRLYRRLGFSPYDETERDLLMSAGTPGASEPSRPAPLQG